jgi:hypothetical protein
MRKTYSAKRKGKIASPVQTGLDLNRPAPKDSVVKCRFFMNVKGARRVAGGRERLPFGMESSRDWQRSKG